MRLRRAMLALVALSAILPSAPALAQKLTLGVARATAEFDPRTAEPIVMVQLDAKGTRAFARLTRANVGRAISVGVSGRVLVAPTVREPIKGGKLQIGGSFDIAKATALAEEVTARGAVELEVVDRP